MLKDAQGLTLTTSSAEAVAGFDNTMAGYLKYRADASLRLKAALKADPECGMLHVLKGSFAMLAYKSSFVPAARESATLAETLTAKATPREKAHVAALTAWTEGEMDRALAIWSGIFTEHPHDLLAFRLHHFCAFWMGRADAMLTAVEGLVPHWGTGDPGLGHGVVAEAAGRAAIELDPGDLWAAHAVAHVLEMQGRRAEGIAWVAGLEQHWEGGNNLMHHLWWHRAMYHMERGEHDQVLHLYDTRFRDLASPVTQMQPDLYIDVQNAASMLFRLGLHGVDPGERWVELADKAEARIGDCLSAFTLPHWMMALAATGRWDAARRMLDGMREFAGANHGTNAPLVARYALPVCEAVLKHGQGDHAGAVTAMRPALGGMYVLGGSHAQQDVLEQLFLNAAMKAGLTEDARLLLERVAGRHAVPPERRVGYAEAARSVSH